MIINTGQRTDIPAFNHHQMTKQDLIGLLIIHDAAEAISEAISSVFGEIGEEEGRFGELQCALSRIILRNASIYDPEKDIDEQEIGELLDMSGNYEERAGRLMGE